MITKSLCTRQYFMMQRFVKYVTWELVLVLAGVELIFFTEAGMGCVLDLC